MQQEIYHECKSDLSSWPYTTAPSSSPRSLLTASDRWHSHDHHLNPEAYVAESTSYLFHDARVECTTSTDEEEEELMRCVGCRQDVVSHNCQQSSFDSNLLLRSHPQCSDSSRPGAGTENRNRITSPATCFCTSNNNNNNNNNITVDEVNKVPRTTNQVQMPSCELACEFKCDMDIMMQQLAVPQFREVTADLMVKVGGKSFKAHRFLLAHYSGYFYNLLKERQGKLFVEVTIRDISPNAFGMLYEWMYTAQLRVNLQNLLEVWYAGQILEIPEAIRLCLDFINNMKNIPEDLFTLYLQSKELGNKPMTEHILRFMCLVYCCLVTSPLFINLDYDGLKFMLMCDNLNVNSEKEVFDSVILWLKGNCEQRRESIEELMKCIRFGHMNEAELFDTLYGEYSASFMCHPECRLMVLDGFLSNTSRNLGNVDHFPQLFALPRRCYWDQSEDLYGLNCIVAKDNERKNFVNPIDRQMTTECMQPSYQTWPKMTQLMPFTKLMPEICEEMSKHERKFSCAKWWSKMKNGTNLLDPAALRTTTVQTEGSPCYSSLCARSSPHNGRSPCSYSASPSPFQNSYSSPSPLLRPTCMHAQCCSPSPPKPVHQNAPLSQNTPLCQYQCTNGNKNSSTQSCWTNNNHQTWLKSNGLSEEDEISKEAENDETRRNDKRIEVCVIMILGGLNPLESWTNPTAGKLVYAFTSKLVYGRREGSWMKYDLELPSPRHHAVAVCSSSYIYLAGGCCPTRSRDGRHIEALNTLWRLDVRNKKWDKMADMIHARIHHGFVALDKLLIALGGQDETGRLLSSVEVYDIREDKWKEVAKMSTPRMGMGATTFRNCVWVCGGMSIKDKEKSPTITKNVECYDVSTNRWCLMNSLRFPRCFGSLVECGGFLHLVGGVTRVSARKDGVISSVASIDIHDYVTDEWSFKAALQVPRHSAAVASLDHNLYIIGGITSLEACALDCVECFNDVKGCWDKTQVHLPLPLSGVSCVVVNIEIEDE